MHPLDLQTALKYAVDRFDAGDATGPDLGNQIFTDLGPGNSINGPSRPHERLCWYEEMLITLRRRDPAKYQELHKGTAFYFSSWLAFDLRRFDTALFYMDAALSEDYRNFGTAWLAQSAGGFLRLKDPESHVAGKHIEHIRTLLEEHLNRFNAACGAALTLDDLVGKFVTRLTREPKQRSVVSAWYVHLLEFEELAKHIDLRSTAGGSTAPFLGHLFRGGLIAESVLKLEYPGHKTLGGIFSDATFRTDFGSGFRTSANSIAEIVRLPATTFGQDSFEVSAKLRNTAGHSLIWDDVFQTPDVFQRLHERTVNAVLLVVAKKF